MKGFFLAVKKIVSFNSPPVPIITVIEVETDKTEEQHDKPVISVMDEQMLE